MTDSDKRDAEVEKTLALLGGINRVRPSPYLADRVLRILDDRGRAPARGPSRGLRLAIAGIIALVIFNVFTLLGAPNRVRSSSTADAAALDSLALEYGLKPQVLQELE
ncbi:MAG TPA: hypothetical protein VMF59_07540 [Bacteroidota bacterium]|nr:hypothetical protein [Bacteroidota bacterium]